MNEKSGRFVLLLFLSLSLVGGFFSQSVCAQHYCYEPSFDDIRKRLQCIPYRCFEEKCLSNPAVSVSILLSYTPELLPVICVERCTGNESDIFYAAQSIWELAAVAPLRAPAGRYFYCCTTARAGGHIDSPELYESRKTNFVSMHLIPSFAMFSRKSVIGSDIIHAKANVVRINISKLKSKRLDDYRREWFTFFGHNRIVTKKDVLRQAWHLKTKYADLFRV